MTPARIVGIVLIILGAIGLVYERLTYTEERHTAELGPLSVSVDEKKTIHIPTWAGIVALVAGIALVAVPTARKA